MIKEKGNLLAVFLSMAEVPLNDEGKKMKNCKVVVSEILSNT